MDSIELDRIIEERVARLCQALQACSSDSALFRNFLFDLLSHSERREIANRFAVAELLMEGRSQVAAAKQLGVALGVSQRVDQSVHGPYAHGGFWEVAEKMRQMAVTRQSVPNPSGSTE